MNTANHLDNLNESMVRVLMQMAADYPGPRTWESAAASCRESALEVDTKRARYLHFAAAFFDRQMELGRPFPEAYYRNRN